MAAIKQLWHIKQSQHGRALEASQGGGGAFEIVGKMRAWLPQFIEREFNNVMTKITKVFSGVQIA